MIRLKQIQIKNYKSIKDYSSTDEITKIFALIGRNNTGKSSFLKAVQVLLCEKEVQISDFHKGTDEPIEITGILEVRNGDEKKEIAFKIVCDKSLKPKYSIDGVEVAMKKYDEIRPELLIVSDIRNPSDSMTGGTKTTILKKILALRQASDEDGNAKEFRDLSAKMEELKKREAAEVSKVITEKFRDITEEQSFEIAITPDVDLEKGVQHKTGLTDLAIPEPKTVVDIMDSGTGLQSMYLLTLLEVYGEMSKKIDNAILLVEEPEVYLHPTYQRRMFKALRRIASDNQVIFTSHSPIMNSEIWLTESVRQVRLNERGESLIENVKIEDVIAELGIRYEDVLNPQLVVFVEGDNDIKFYESLGLIDPRLKIIATDTFRALHYFAFIKIMSSEHVKNTFVLIADGDGVAVADRTNELKNEIGKQFKTPPSDLDAMLKEKIHVLDEYSIESYFLTEECLSKAFPEIDKSQIVTFIAEYKKGYKEKLDAVTKGTLVLEELQKYGKPKLIFETFKSEKFGEHYAKFWEGYNTFLSVRELIAQLCKAIGAKGGNPFEHVLGHADIKSTKELAEKKEKILALLK